jgi:hypothetical protein
MDAFGLWSTSKWQAGTNASINNSFFFSFTLSLVCCVNVEGIVKDSSSRLTDKSKTKQSAGVKNPSSSCFSECTRVKSRKIIPVCIEAWVTSCVQPNNPDNQGIKEETVVRHSLWMEFNSSFNSHRMELTLREGRVTLRIWLITNSYKYRNSCFFSFPAHGLVFVCDEPLERKSVEFFSADISWSSNSRPMEKNSLCLSLTDGRVFGRLSDRPSVSGTSKSLSWQV